MSTIDIVIPAHAKDLRTLRWSIPGALRYVEPIRHVYVVSATAVETPDPRVRWVPEPNGGSFPSLTDVRQRLAARDAETPRATWIYQQLLKLGAAEYIEELTTRYLVIDADVIFLRPVSFRTEGNVRFLYARTPEYHAPYRNAHEYLLGRQPKDGHSVIAHHMLYDGELLSELKGEIAAHCGRAWHEAYVDATDPAEPSAISEPDVYGWWVLDHHPEVAKMRRLVWRDVHAVPGPIGRRKLARDYDFVAAHAYLRKGLLRRNVDAASRVYRRFRPHPSGISLA